MARRRDMLDPEIYPWLKGFDPKDFVPTDRLKKEPGHCGAVTNFGSTCGPMRFYNPDHDYRVLEEAGLKDCNFKLLFRGRPEWLPVPDSIIFDMKLRPGIVEVANASGNLAEQLVYRLASSCAQARDHYAQLYDVEDPSIPCPSHRQLIEAAGEILPDRGLLPMTIGQFDRVVNSVGVSCLDGLNCNLLFPHELSYGESSSKQDLALLVEHDDLVPGFHGRQLVTIGVVEHPRLLSFPGQPKPIRICMPVWVGNSAWN